MNIFDFKFLLGVIAITACIPSAGHADDAQMLPPTVTGVATGCPLSSNPQLLIYNAAGVSSNSIAPNVSAINCTSSLTADPSSGRIISGSPGTGGIWVDGGAAQFVGSMDAATVGIYNNGAWALRVDNADHVLVEGELQIPSGAADMVHVNPNQIWNSGGWLFLNYSAPAGYVYIGGAGQQESLYIAQGDVQIPNGGVQVGNSANCTPGMIKYDGTDFYGCYASGWKKLGGGGGSGTLISTGYVNGRLSGSVTANGYSYCALTHVSAINAGHLYSFGCDISNSGGGTWVLSGNVSNSATNAGFQCDMLCF